MLALLPGKGFDGVLPNDGHRHAPPAHMTAWSDSHRLLTFVWEDYDPGVFTITYVRRDLILPVPTEQEVYARVKHAILHPSPAACLDKSP